MAAAATGTDLSSATLWRLRTGSADNLSPETLTALAAFFAVILHRLPRRRVLFADHVARLTYLCDARLRGTRLVLVSGFAPSRSGIDHQMSRP
jgi:hypothetical protein